jgi:hypothetical protein
MDFSGVTDDQLKKMYAQAKGEAVKSKKNRFWDAVSSAPKNLGKFIADIPEGAYETAVGGYKDPIGAGAAAVNSLTGGLAFSGTADRFGQSYPKGRQLIEAGSWLVPATKAAKALKLVPKALKAPLIAGGIGAYGGAGRAAKEGEPMKEIGLSALESALGSAATAALPSILPVGARALGVSKATGNVANYIRPGSLAKKTITNMYENPALRDEIAEGGIHKKAADIQKQYLAEVEQIPKNFRGVYEEAYKDISPKTSINATGLLNELRGNLKEYRERNSGFEDEKPYSTGKKVLERTLRDAKEAQHFGRIPFEKYQNLMRDLNELSEPIPYGYKTIKKPLIKSYKYLKQHRDASSPKIAAASKVYSAGKRAETTLDRALKTKNLMSDYDPFVKEKSEVRAAQMESKDSAGDSIARAIDKAQRQVGSHPEYNDVGLSNLKDTLRRLQVAEDIPREIISPHSKSILNSFPVVGKAVAMLSPSAKGIARGLKKGTITPEMLKSDFRRVPSVLPDRLNSLIAYSRVPQSNTALGVLLGSGGKRAAAGAAAENRRRNRI